MVASNDLVAQLRKMAEVATHYRGRVLDPEAMASAADEITRLTNLVKVLLPYLFIDVRSGLSLGTPPDSHPADGCQDCHWYEMSCQWERTILSGELDRFMPGLSQHWATMPKSGFTKVD